MKLKDVIYKQGHMNSLAFVIYAWVILSRELGKEQRTNKPWGRMGQERVCGGSELVWNINDC